MDAGQLWVKEVPGVDMSSEAEEFHNLSIEMQQLCNEDKEALTNPMRHQVRNQRDGGRICFCHPPRNILESFKGP